MGVLLRPLAWLGAFLAALGLLAAWLVPPRLDWTAYRVALQQIASDQLGREFRIEGPFALTLLPAPRLVARGVVIGEEGDGFTGSADELRLTLALGRLLLGEVAVTELTLVSPRIAVRDLPMPLWAAAVRPAPFLAGARVSLERGTVSVGGVRLSDVSARLSAQGPLGPYAVSGSFGLGGMPVEAQVTLGRAGVDGAATLEAAFASRGARVSAGGLVLHGGFVFSGRVEAEGPDLSAFLPAPALPFRAEARLAVEGGAGSADQLALQLGPSRLTGAVSFATRPEPRVDVALAAVRVALDPWIEPARGALAATPFPVGLDLSFEAAEIGGGALRSLRASLVISDRQVAVNEASAVLPGGAALAIGGAVAAAARGPRFEGLMELDAPDLRALLAWAGASPTWAGPEALRSLTLSARMAAEPGLLQIEHAAGRLDGVPVEGGVVIRPAPAPGQRLQLGAGLRLARIDLDALLGAEGLVSVLPQLAGFDTNLRLETGVLATRGITAGDVTVDATLAEGRIALRRLTAGNLAGGRLTLSAAAELGAAPRVTAFDLDFVGADASRLGALFPGSEILAATTPVWQGGFTMRAAGRAAGEQIEVTALAELLDARLEIAGSADHGLNRASGRVALRHPGAPRLLSALGLGDTEAWLGEGSLAVVAEGALAAATLTLRNAEVVAGRLRTRLSGEVTPTETGGRVRLAAEAETLPLPGIDWGESAPLPLAALAGWSGTLALRAAELPIGATAGLSRVEAAIALDDGTIRVGSLHGQVRGGRVTGSASLSAAGALAADWVLADAVLDQPLFGTPFDLAGGSIGVTASITAAGLSPAAWRASLSGEARITAGMGVLAGFGMAAAAEALTAPLPEAEALARVRRALAGGASGFDSLSAELRAERGIISLTEATFQAQNGHAEGTGEIDLRAGALSLSLSVTPTGGAEALPDLGLRASGPIDEPRRVVETAAAARFLAERSRPPRR
ncbi:MAG: AsmA family protein [Acetobacteraceae bacterium]|nr:AsmA family protein [Acetobacteraceae bacterium]